MSPTEITQDIARSLLPGRPPDGHKGTFGHLYAIAGSRGFTGAAKMVGEAACRSGVGLVTLGVPEPLGDVVASDLLETMTMLLPATPDESIAASAIAPALDFAENKEAVVLGLRDAARRRLERAREFFPVSAESPATHEATPLRQYRRVQWAAAS